MNNSDTIVAIATGPGGAISVIRVNGAGAISAVEGIFIARNGKSLSSAPGYTVHFGEIVSDTEIVDEVLVTVFRAPHSYTGEDSVEISCHASPYIENRIIELLLAAGISSYGTSGAVRLAEPGEFTIRAFLAGKLDLSQAEAVADLIASHDKVQHRLAVRQMRGGVSSALAELRGELVELAALLELELDFGEEDVEFASRDRLKTISDNIAAELDRLVNSFSLGNAIRRGVPVAIVGRPNAGKSTLLNALVGDDRAMVSDIAGTTRDRIEERVNLGGITFRFIDTAGLRDTDDRLELMGIDRTLDAVEEARIVLLVVDAGDSGRIQGSDGIAGFDDPGDIAAQISDLDLRPDQRLCVVLNKIDSHSSEFLAGTIFLNRADGMRRANGANDTNGAYVSQPENVMPDFGPNLSPNPNPNLGPNFVSISAKTGQNLSSLTDWLSGTIDTSAIDAGAAVVSNARHYEALTLSRAAVGNVSAGIDSGLSADLIAEDIRQVLHHLGTINGSVTTDELLGTIFSRFCIGK